MDYVIAIPSYNRAKVLEEKTLAVLAKYDVPPDKIYVFVADPEQALAYASVPKDLYGHLVVGLKGLKEQRNFIYEYFPVGCRIVSFDDDVAALDVLVGEKLEPLQNLLDLIDRGFRLCEEHKFRVWGIAPVRNSFYMRDTVSTNTKFLVGHMFGIINTAGFRQNISFKEDYERSLYFCKADGGVVRFNGVAAKTRLGAKGGLDTAGLERMKRNKEDIEYLLTQYPGMLRLNPRREGEILLVQPKKTKK